ncbi:mycofactocin biosynthesis chaperone MftB [Streptomyces sp. NPDC002623]
MSAPHTPATAGFALDGAWTLDPQVAVRPEPFGALLYHFGTRRLSFVKDRTLLAVIRALADQPSARAACHVADVPEADMPRYRTALATLAASRMITPRDELPRGDAPRTKEAP